MDELLAYIAKGLVDDPDEVQVTQERTGDTVILKLTVASDDMGKIIGRRGRTIRAIRDVMRAAATKADVTTVVDVVE